MIPAATTTPAIERHRFSVDDYHFLAEHGLFAPSERVELIRGELQLMQPLGPDHSSHTSSFIDTIRPKCPPTLALRLEQPVVIPPDSEPQPDLAVVRRRADYYKSAHPRPADVLLIVEVADSSVAFDTGGKARLYAQAGIPEYWVLDLPAQRVRIFREPRGDGYKVGEALTRGETARCGTVPELVIEVGDLLL